MLLWEVVIDGELCYTKHIITLCGRKSKCYSILKQVARTLTVVLEDIFKKKNLPLRKDRHSGSGVHRYIKIQRDIRFGKYHRLSLSQPRRTSAARFTVLHSTVHYLFIFRQSDEI